LLKVETLRTKAECSFWYINWADVFVPVSCFLVAHLWHEGDRHTQSAKKCILLHHRLYWAFPSEFFWVCFVLLQLLKTILVVVKYA
jgi:hypothetical protein